MCKAYLALRLVLVLGLLLLGSLVCVRVKVVWLFRLQVGATEFGHWFALGALVLAIVGPWRSGAALLGVVAFGLLISTAVRAARYAGNLPQAGPRSAPFAWGRLFLGKATVAIAPQTLEYARYKDATLRLDFFKAAVPTPAPCVILIHVGGWDSGSRVEFEPFSQMLAQEGFAVASIDYRLAPQHRWPAQREDVLEALHFLQGQREALGIAADQFILMGRSAGGQIASAVALGVPDPAIRACISLYAPADLHFAWEYADPNDILNSDKLLRQYLGGTPQEQPAAYDSASGIRFAQRESVPVLLVHGSIDEMVWVKQSQRLAAKLAEVGAKHEFWELPWATHGCDFNPNGPSGQITEWAVLRFLHETLGRP